MKHILLALTGLLLATTAAQAAPSYRLTKSVALGAPDRWDYVVYDPDSGRVFVAQGDRLAVIDARSGAIIGHVTGIAGGTHGTAIATSAGQGFTDDGDNGTAVVFDLHTLQIIRQVPADSDADAMARDGATGHVFVISGDPGTITVIAPGADKVVATIKAGEKMEYAASDGSGAMFVAGVEKSDVLKIDTGSNAVVARWATPDCTAPHGLAIDKPHHRLFMGCINAAMMVLDTDSGRIVAKLPIGQGSDAVAFDPVRGRVFSSNGRDGTITVYQETTPDSYAALEPVVTAVSGRTMAVDPNSGRLFVAAAQTRPATTPGGRPQTRPGTLKLLMFDPQ